MSCATSIKKIAQASIVLSVCYAISGCTAIAITGAVVGTGISVAATAVNVGVAVGSTAVSATTSVVQAAVPGD